MLLLSKKRPVQDPKALIPKVLTNAHKTLNAYATSWQWILSHGILTRRSPWLSAMMQFDIILKTSLEIFYNNAIWYDSVNMSGLVIILWPFDMILQTCSVLHYKLINFSELVWTCLNLSELVWTCLWRFLNMSKLVQNQHDMNCYDSQTSLNLFRINMIWIDVILKHV